MAPIAVMVNGVPGNVATLVARRVDEDPRFRLVPYSLTGPGIDPRAVMVGGTSVRLVPPADRQARMNEILEAEGEFITIDFTHPTAVNDNAVFYVANGLHFVMGTTGGDRERLALAVTDSAISAVIAPNMAKQIVGLQAMMAFAAENFPGLFAGYELEIRESHQKGKADTSGTARAMVRHFNDLGCAFTEDMIQMERDPEVQRKEWGVPEEYLGGHAWHTYTLRSPDGTALFALTHNINGREIYVHGTLDAVVYLEAKRRQGIRGRVFSMIDVLRG